MATFTREEIESGLRKLGEFAHAKGLKIQLTLVGGAVMVLRFGCALIYSRCRRSHSFSA